MRNIVIVFVVLLLTSCIKGKSSSDIENTDSATIHISGDNITFNDDVIETIENIRKDYFATSIPKLNSVSKIYFETIKESSTKKIALIYCDNNIEYGVYKVVENSCRKAGFTHVKLMYEKPEYVAVGGNYFNDAGTELLELNNTLNKGERVDLSLLVSGSGSTVGAKGGFLPTIFVDDFWTFKDGKGNEIVEILPTLPQVKQFKTTGYIEVDKGNITKKYSNRIEVSCYATDSETSEEAGELLKVLHNTSKELIVDKNFKPLFKNMINKNDTLIIFKKYIEYRKLSTVKNKLLKDEQSNVKSELADIESKLKGLDYTFVVEDPDLFFELKINAHDIMLSRLIGVQPQFKNYSDSNQVMISSESEVEMIKLIPLYEGAKALGFETIRFVQFRTNP